VTPVRFPPRRAQFAALGETPRPVVGIDCDGTLSRYHEHFTAFAEQYLGINLPGDYPGDMPFWKWLGVSRERYREVKLHYRMSGLKRAMPVYPHAAEMVAAVRATGAEVIICTTRPFLKVDGVEEDTREFLRRNTIRHDGIIHGEHKYRELARRFPGRRIVAVLDDLPEMVDQAIAENLPAFLIRREHNRLSTNAGSIYSLQQAQEYLVEAVRAWTTNQKLALMNLRKRERAPGL
jgi:hypothetical protein